MNLVQAAGGRCYGYVCDLCNREDVYKKAALVKEEVGKVRVARTMGNYGKETAPGSPGISPKEFPNSTHEIRNDFIGDYRPRHSLSSR